MRRSPARSTRCCAAPRSRTRACSPCSTPSSTTCPPRSTSPPIEGHDVGDEDKVVARQPDDDEPFSALAFKIMRDPLPRQAHLHPGLLRASSTPAPQVLNSTKGKKERIGKIFQMHANKRETRSTTRRRPHRRGHGPEGHDHGRHAVRPGAPGRPRVDDVPGAGHPRRHRAQDQGRPGEARHRDPAPRRGGPDLPGPHRRGDRPDDHRRHGRAAPRHPRRPHAARVQGRGQRRQAAGGLPRDDPQARSRSTTTRTRSRPAARASTRRSRSTIEPLDAATATVATSSRTRSPVAASRASTSRASTHGIQDAMQFGVLAGYPMVGVKATLLDGAVPRRRLLGDGVQDRRLDGVQGGRPARPTRPCSSRSWPSRSARPRTTWATSSATSTRRRGHIQAMEDASGAKVVTRARPALGDVRLRRRPAQQDAGPGRLLHAVRLLRRGSPERRGGDHQEGPRRVVAEPRIQQHLHDPRPESTRARRSRRQATSPRRTHSGEGEVRADQAARQHRHHRSHRPRQDDADRGDHQGAARQVPGPQPLHAVRPDRQGAGGAAARYHDLDRARRVPDRGAALRARRLPGSRRLHQEHDHGCGADGRRDPRGRRHRRPDAADEGARPPGPPGRRPLHRRRAEQGRHGRRRGDPRARRARGPRAAVAATSSPATTCRSCASRR